MADDMEQKSDNFVDRVKESPRTVSALIIILIVAAAIYAFSGNKAEQPKEAIASPEATTSPVTEEKAAVEATKDGKKVAEKTTPVATPKAVTKEELTKKSQELPKATKTNEGYAEVAQRGDGLTHLARRASTRWLSENKTDYTVTNEHRIYIEDYVRKQMAKEPVKIGDSKTVSFNLIADAVKAAGQLNEKQLQNLTKYTQALK